MINKNKKRSKNLNKEKLYQKKLLKNIPLYNKEEKLSQVKAQLSLKDLELFKKPKIILNLYKNP